VNPEKSDKLCRAKIAVVEALNRLEFDDERFYLRGVRYVQLEPVWGGTSDTAAPMRVGCAMGLVRVRHRGVLALLVDMLADKEKLVRVGAAQALSYSGSEAASLLLRLKARLGDRDPEVVSECFTGILDLTAEKGVSFVAEFLSHVDEAVQDGALLALGSSRRPEAFEVLRSYAQTHRGDRLEAAHMALALLRLAAATDYLLELLADPSQTVALSALAALAVQRYDPQVCKRAAEAVARSGNDALSAEFRRRFQTDEGSRAERKPD
jgi:HEAT repeat protein